MSCRGLSTAPHTSFVFFFIPGLAVAGRCCLCRVAAAAALDDDAVDLARQNSPMSFGSCATQHVSRMLPSLFCFVLFYFDADGKLQSPILFSFILLW
jgi:hypothetical protein